MCENRKSSATNLTVERRVSIVGAWHPTLAGEVGLRGAVVDRVVHPWHAPDKIPSQMKVALQCTQKWGTGRLDWILQRKLDGDADW